MLANSLVSGWMGYVEHDFMNEAYVLLNAFSILKNDPSRNSGDSQIGLVQCGAVRQAVIYRLHSDYT